MISILIPTHDYTCYKLVYDLHEQAERLGVQYEIIVAEDGSRDQVSVIANHKITDLSNCKHVVFKQNLGPAAIRNELAEIAQYEWILFLDSDAFVDKNDFLQTYIDNKDQAEVIIGGLHHQDINHNPNRSLRFKYEKAADKHRSASERKKNPYSHLSTFNLFVHRPMFMQIQFNKQCHEYGYEDALFGVELKQRNISILHIDNPLMHKGLDTNEVFIKKTETALRTLKSLKGKMNGHSHVENMYNKFKQIHLAWVLCLFHKVFNRAILCNLKSANPSLCLFSIYKLGYYACL
ncbi:MAG: glycosyltransferase family 2 protein [Prevotellaceae bacterium]|nr:glycosyltransferase family 2 protein [Candidatus Minthosoma caballi]